MTSPTIAPADWPETDDFINALLTGDQPRALQLLAERMDGNTPFVDIEHYLIRPALYEVGARWSRGEVSVAQEHLATSMAGALMTTGLLRSVAAPLVHKRVLLAGVGGNEHALGIRMVADAFQLAGWDVRYLGANMPGDALVGQTVIDNPDLVGLSMALEPHLAIGREMIALLHARLGDSSPPVFIGGLAVNRFPELARAIGADLVCADARSAVADAHRLTMRDRGAAR